MSFKYYLLNENNISLSSKVGDVLTAVHDLQTDIDNLGTRHVVRVSDSIVNQLRIILHSQWSPRQQKHLEQLQRIAVFLKNTIEEKGDIKEVIPTVARELEVLTQKLGGKVSDKLKGAEEAAGEDVEQDDLQLTGDGPKKPQPGQNGPQIGGMENPQGTPAPEMPDFGD